MPVPSWGDTVTVSRVRALLRRYRWRLADRFRPHIPPASPPSLKGKTRLRIGFVVCEPAKWGLGSLLEHLQSDPAFDVGFYPTLSDVHLRLPRSARQEEYRQIRAFFAEIGSIWGDLYHSPTDRQIPPDAINCDIVFVQQPWGMQDLPRRLAGRVRTAYVHYGMAVIKNDQMQFGLPDFHPFLWRYFLPTQAHVDAINHSAGPRPPKMCVTGHPKFDAYLRPALPRDQCLSWPNLREAQRKRVIFAPHHALEPGSLQLGTFAWSGPAMLQIAQAHPEIDFLLRPHPNMALGLSRSHVMNAQEWQAYRTAWQALPNAALFEDTPYFDTFRSSDAMVTDSGSFLAEYLPTEAPLIRLERVDAAPLNSFGQTLAAGFYTADNQADLETQFSELILEGKDPLAQVRTGLVPLLVPFAQPAADKIVAELRSLM